MEVTIPIQRVKVNTPLGSLTLASDEQLVSIVPSPLHLPKERLPVGEIVRRMGSAPNFDELGRHGPLVASAVNPENQDNPELRRYEAKFGRDAFYAAEFLADVCPQLEEGTVRYFAALQATEYDDRSLAEPGKIPNHVRDEDDPIARKLTSESGRRWPWYGGTDTTVQFLLAVGRVLRRTPELSDEVVVYPSDHRRAGEPVTARGSSVTHGRAAWRALKWLLQKLEATSEPFIWVSLNRKDSFTVWTDSPNAFAHIDGKLVPPPIAPVQLQAQVYDALVAGAQFARRINSDLDPDRLEAVAQRLRTAFLMRFTVEDAARTYLACAVHQPAGAAAPLPVRSRTVNMGLVLDSAIIQGAACRNLREGIISQLFGPELLSPFGIVGRARDEVRFERFDYHSQVWGFATYKVANGLRRYGYDRLAAELDTRLLGQTRDGIFPENVGAGTKPGLEYCPHILTVRRPAPDGLPTVTVKERTPAVYAAWTAAAVMAIEERPVIISTEPSAFEQAILKGLPGGHAS